MCLQGGYKTHTVTQIGNLIWCFNTKKISLRALRIYFACLVIVAAREAAKRSRRRDKTGARELPPRYLVQELARLTGCRSLYVRRELRLLERAGLLLFSETEIVFTKSQLPGSQDVTAMLAGRRSIMRPIPLPRPLLRYLAQCSKIAVIKTILAYCTRGLSLSRTGEVAGKGTAKASWIAKVTGLSLRAVRTARAGLIAIAFIADDEGSKQWKLNRDGAYFSINLAWSNPAAQENVLDEGADATIAVDNSPSLNTHFAPPIPQKRPEFAPPYKDLKTPKGLKNQKTQQADHSGFYRKETKNPNLNDIQLDDLRRLSRLKELYRQAVLAKWLSDSEANLRNFVAAAVRATRVHGDAVKIFVSIVRQGLWHQINHEQEDRAREVLRRERERARVTQLSLVHTLDLLNCLRSVPT